MRPETEGKIIVGLIISLIAFGCGSGVGIVIGISQNDTNSPFSLNYSQPNSSEVVYVSKSGSNSGNNNGNTNGNNKENTSSKDNNTNPGY
jgi:hypothetical protein